MLWGTGRGNPPHHTLPYPSLLGYPISKVWGEQSEGEEPAWLRLSPSLSLPQPSPMQGAKPAARKRMGI